MANQSGGPGTYTGTGNVFNGVGTGTYVLEGDGVLGLIGNAGATIDGGTVANIVLGLDLIGIGLAVLSTVDITALSGGIANLQTLIGAVAGPTTLNAEGGTVEVGSTITALGNLTVNISLGGGYDAYSSLIALLSSSTVNFGVGGGNYTIEATGLSVNLLTGSTINGFATGDTIDDQNIAFSAVQSYTISAAGLVTFFSNADATGQLGGLQFAAGTFAAGSYGAASGPLTLSNDGSFLQIQLTCFLRGSRIATEAGETAIEQLRVGDHVSILSDGEIRSRPIKWIGRRQIDLRGINPAIDAYPIRIRAHAFAENKPRRDLLITSEHCLFVDGRLVPARMLVNGASIIVDRAIAQYEYFHIELDQHAILIAEGLETESYIDTGNRGNFSNAAVASLIPDFTVDAGHGNWQDDAAAPLAVSREEVEPIWQRLALRADQLGLSAPACNVALVDDPDLHLLTDAGVEIRPTLFDGKAYAFVIPGGARQVRLVSRACRPSETVGPFLDDRRTLGVLVGRIGIGAGRRRTVLERHLGDDALSGWHEREAGAAGRWTNGNSPLPLDFTRFNGKPAFLDIEIISAGPYLAEPPAAQAVAA